MEDLQTTITLIENIEILYTPQFTFLAVAMFVSFTIYIIFAITIIRLIFKFLFHICKTQEVIKNTHEPVPEKESEPLDAISVQTNSYMEERKRMSLQLNKKIVASRSKVVELWSSVRECSSKCDEMQNNMFNLELEIEQLAIRHNMLELTSDARAVQAYKDFNELQLIYDTKLLELKANKTMCLKFKDDLEKARKELYENSNVLYEYLRSSEEQCAETADAGLKAETVGQNSKNFGIHCNYTEPTKTA